MATQHYFDSRVITIPGAYSTIKSGIKNPALALDFGNTLLIDTGSSVGIGGFFGGGAGINGTLKTGKDTHYTFDNVRDFRNFIGGGLWWKLGEAMFLPGGGAPGGISSLTYIRAKTTVPAEITVPFGTGDSDTDNDGELVVQVRQEGYVGNGVLGDETRAQSTLTVTNAGSEGDSVSIVVDGQTIASYTTVFGDTIANVVTGLVASITSIGLCEVVSSNTTQIVIKAPRGYATDLNGDTPTVNNVGALGVTPTTFTGGVEGTLLTRGYAAKVIAGVLDTNKFIVNFYKGSFKGTDNAISSGTSWNDVSELSTVAELLVQSPEVDTVQELVTWMQDEFGDGFVFNQYFKLKSYVVDTTDEILTDDITSGYIKAISGSESFSASDLNSVLDSISDLYFDFIIADDWGDNARSTSNLSILDWITNEARIKPDLYVAGGSVVGKWNSGSTSSNSLAVAFNSQYVTLVHGGVKRTSVGGNGFKEYDSIYKAAYLLGREAGGEPQVPLTFKGIGIQGELHPLENKDLKLGLSNGVLMTRLDNGSFECVKGINTLQNNTYLVNPDGTTHDKQLARIVRQLNKEITVNAKQQLLKGNSGPNRNTVSVEDIKAWIEGYLQSKVATTNDDNLILSFENVSVTVNQDAYEVVYQFTPNFPVAFLFFTGVIIDPNTT